MGEVFEINGKRLFSLHEAKRVLPAIQRITKRAVEEVEKKTTQLSYARDKEKKTEIEDQIHAVFKRWHEGVHKLGCEAKGMWLVDFDSGEGYYCWHYPEPSLSFFHGYLEGFRGRVKLT